MDEEYEGLRATWLATGDPRWVWRAIRAGVHDGDLPAWALNYLVDVADGIEKAEGAAGRELHRLLKFPEKPGPWRSNDQMLRNERFAVEFIRHMLKGKTPGKARDEAARIEGIPADPDEQMKRLREFFGLDRLPRRSLDQSWKMIIATWLINNYPAYVKRYPDLPKPPFDFKGPPPGWFT